MTGHLPAEIVWFSFIVFGLQLGGVEVFGDILPGRIPVAQILGLDLVFA
jgi:hypothetical protein